MDITTRIRQILLILLKQKEAIPIEQLANDINVSKRTIHREAKYISSILKQHELEFASKTGLGVWIDGTEQNKANLMSFLNDDNTVDVSAREYRQKRIILDLLKEKGIKKLYWYSSKFKVSDATISADLELLDGWFAKYDLKIVRKPGSGISLEGSEENYRKAIRSFIRKNINNKVIEDAYKLEFHDSEIYEQFEQNGMAHMLKDDVLKRVVLTLNNMKNTQISNLTQSSYIGLIMHTSIAIDRIFQNQTIDTDNGLVEQFHNSDDDYKLAEKIVLALEKEFELRIPKIECAYICLHIKGSKHEKINVDLTPRFDVENKQIKLMMNDMIYAFDNEKEYQLKQDEEFIQGLLAHLQPTIVRLSYNMKIHNPILQEIKQEYPEIFDRCKIVANVMSKHLSTEIPEEEIGFLSVHFGAALLRIEEKVESYRTVNVGVVCSSGIGVARLMMTKLKKIFKDRVSLTAYGKSELTKSVINKEDFFVSSIVLDDIDADIIVVNALLGNTDIDMIQKQLNEVEVSTENVEEDELSTVADLDEIHFLTTQIRNIIADCNVVRLDKATNYDDLLKAISTIVTDDIDNQKAIIDALVQREKISTQVFAELGFALFHASTNGVSKPRVNIFITEDLEEFEDQYFKKIKTVFCMLIPNDEHRKTNADILGCISSSLVEDDKLLNVVATGDYDRIKKYLSTVLRVFLAKYIK